MQKDHSCKSVDATGQTLYVARRGVKSVAIELHVQYLIVAACYAGVAALVVLVAVVAPDKPQSGVGCHLHLVYIAYADALSAESGGRCRGGILALLGKAILAPGHLNLLFLLFGRLEYRYDAIARDEIIIGSQLQNEASSFRPRRAVSGPRVPWQGVIMAACKDNIVVCDDLFAGRRAAPMSCPKALWARRDPCPVP